MKAVKRKDTAPEITIRKMLHSLGYRYRLHDKSLPGSPDIVFTARRAVIFVHGCFWHGHACSKGHPPKSRTDYWLPKIDRNKHRDATNITKLAAVGWQILTIWQCELDDPAVIERLTHFLGPKKHRPAPISPSVTP